MNRRVNVDISGLTSHDLGWLYGLANSRVKKQRRRLENYEAREGDDTDHFDVLAVNLTRMEDTLARLKPLAPDQWEWDASDGDDVETFIQDMGACVECPHPEGCPVGHCEKDAR